MYSIKTEESEDKRAKGVKKNVVRNFIKHDDYRNVLFDCNKMYVSMNTIR